LDHHAGKLVFAEPIPKDNEAATWREKIDQVYKSSSQNFRVVVHGSKVSLQSSPFFFLPLVYKVNFCFSFSVTSVVAFEDGNTTETG